MLHGLTTSRWECTTSLAEPRDLFLFLFLQIEPSTEGSSEKEQGAKHWKSAKSEQGSITTDAFPFHWFRGEIGRGGPPCTTWHRETRPKEEAEQGYPFLSAVEPLT